MTRFALLVFSAILPALAFSQSVVPAHDAVTSVIERLREPNPVQEDVPAFSSPISHPMLEVSSLLKEEFWFAEFYLNDGTVAGPYLANFNIYLNEFYLKSSSSSLRVLRGDDVKAFGWKPQTRSSFSELYITGRDYRSAEGDTVSGFFQVANQGAITLLIRTVIVAKNANLHTALQDLEFYQRKRYYYLKDDAILRLPPARKIPAIFGKHESPMKKFISDNNFDLNHGAPLLETIEYYNSRFANK
jgi:hypothetical protein